ISSSTIALQEQLTTRDLPFFTSAAGIDAKIELAKGRTRYVCAYRLNQVIGDMHRSPCSRENSVLEVRSMMMRSAWKSKRWRRISSRANGMVIATPVRL
ncbi:MAG: hypothetical protein RL091_2405, partial [Verrucomicrobiota bacterium]